MKHPGPNLHARDYRVERIPHHEAAWVVKLWHYSKSVPNTGQTHGLFARDRYPVTPLLGAALWLPPTRRAAESVAGDGWAGVLALSRLVVDPALPRNAASYLLASSMRLLDRDRWPVLLTYADTRHGHDGAIYRATGWSFEGEGNTGYYFVTRDGRQVGRKRGKRNVPTAQLLADGCQLTRSVKLKYVHRRTA